MGKPVKTISLAPTWEWTVAMLLRLIEDGNQPKAEKGFYEEVSRLGDHVTTLVEDFRKIKKTRKTSRELLLDYARKCDAHLAQKASNK